MRYGIARYRGIVVEGDYPITNFDYVYSETIRDSGFEMFAADCWLVDKLRRFSNLDGLWVVYSSSSFVRIRPARHFMNEYNRNLLSKRKTYQELKNSDEKKQFIKEDIFNNEN